MIRPISIATDGYLCKSTLSIAVNGYICISKVPVKVVKYDDASTGEGSSKIHISQTNEKMLKQEDEEILLILNAFVQCQS